MRSFALAFLLAPLAAFAQDHQYEVVATSEGPVTLCVLHETDQIFEGVNQLRETARLYESVSQAKSQGGATFEVTYDGFTPEAQAAFQAAVDIWSAHIESPIPIKVQASFESLGSNVLGGASSGRIVFFQSPNVPDGAQANTWYSLALGDALLNQDICRAGTSCAGTADIIARFSNSRTDWYFGTDGNPPSNRFDFTSVVLHELGHGLGFFGSVTRDDGVEGGGNPAECTGTVNTFCHSFVGYISQGFPVIYDRFTEDADGTSILNETQYPNPSTAVGPLGVLVRSRDLYWDSPTVLAVNENIRPEIYAPNPFEVGSSFSHWDEAQFPGGTVNAVMTPQVDRGESFLNPGPATCALFQDIGWTLAEGCASLVVSNEEAGPLAEALDVRLTGPNPFRTSTALQVRLAEPQDVRATLHDALGREVAVLHEGNARGPLTLRVSDDLAPGVYVVRVRAETGMASERIVRIR